MPQILTFSQLVQTLNYQKYRQKKKVLVTGCFDLLHQEHAKFLRNAKRVGETLIVGLESDARVSQLKGPNRPINCATKRAANLAQLKFIDFIFILPQNFNHPLTRRKILQLIKPDILALSTHDPLQKQKQQECRPVGCQVQIVHSYNPQISSTKILQEKKPKIKNKKPNP